MFNAIIKDLRQRFYAYIRIRFKNFWWDVLMCCSFLRTSMSNLSVNSIRGTFLKMKGTDILTVIFDF